jgi:hypothetical protein
VNAKLGKQLRDAAQAAGKNESEVVREALNAYFTRRVPEESALDMARRAGIIGCAKGLPADLSTNKNHFEGFGR